MRTVPSKRERIPKKVFVKTRPDYLEAEAIFRAITIATVTHCPLYVVHVSTAKGSRSYSAGAGRGTGGLCGVMPAVSYLDGSRPAEEGTPGEDRSSPSIRFRPFCALEGHPERDIDVIASDHAPKAKKINDPFFEAAYGSAQAETMLSVAYDEGINSGWIGPCQLVRLLSENPAKIFGLYPKKRRSFKRVRMRISFSSIRLRSRRFARRHSIPGPLTRSMKAESAWESLS